MYSIYIYIAPLSCGSPDVQQNTTLIGRNFSIGSQISYQCPTGHSLIGDAERKCRDDGTWSGKAPVCKCKFSYSTNNSNIFSPSISFQYPIIYIIYILRTKNLLDTRHRNVNVLCICISVIH